MAQHFPKRQVRMEFEDEVAHSPGNWMRMEWTPEIEESVKFSMGILGLTIDSLRARGIRVVVTGVPHLPQYHGKASTRPHQSIEETARKHGAHFLNSFEALRPAVLAAPNDRYYWATDPTHFNAAGNVIWAEAQLRFFQENAQALLP